MSKRERPSKTAEKDRMIKKDLRNRFGGYSRREARCLGKSTGKTTQDAPILPSSQGRGAIKRSR